MSDENEPQSEPHPPQVPLSYRAPKDDRRANPNSRFGLQMFAGFMAWIGGVVLVFAFATRDHSANATTVQVAAAGVFIIHVISVWRLYAVYNWKGYLPGLLLGLGITCLVPIGIVWVICGNPFRPIF